MARIVTIACMAVVGLFLMSSFQIVAPRDGLIILGGKAFAADMYTKAPVAPPAPVGKGKYPIIGKGKGKAPIVTRG
jgi:hypothetical protein